MDQIRNAPILSLIALGVVLFVLFSLRHRFGQLKLAQHSASLSLGMLVTLGALALWQDIRGNGPNRSAIYAESGQIALNRARDGHYYATLTVNGALINFVVDTGATSVVLTKDAARAAGIDPNDLSFFTEAMTANGAVPTSPVVLDNVTFENIHDKRVRAFVNGGDMRESLLGMSYLNRFSKIEISQGQLVLTR